MCLKNATKLSQKNLLDNKKCKFFIKISSFLRYVAFWAQMTAIYIVQGFNHCPLTDRASLCPWIAGEARA